MEVEAKKQLQNEELYFQCGELIKSNITTMQKEISTLKMKLIDQRKRMLERASEVNPVLKSTINTYQHAQEEMLKLENVCEEFILGMKVDMTAEARDRLEPSSKQCLQEVAEAYDTFKESFKRSRAVLAHACPHVWSNIPDGWLEDTRVIENKWKEDGYTHFHESDLKFKQDMSILRSKMFTSKATDASIQSKLTLEFYNDWGAHNDGIQGDRIETAWKRDSISLSENVELDLRKVKKLQFIEGEFQTSDRWIKILDAAGEQLASKWHIVVRPQIEKLLKKRRVPNPAFNPTKMYDYLKTIPENGFNFIVTKYDLVTLFVKTVDAGLLKSWRLHLKDSEEKLEIAATLIQSHWRGHQARKRIEEMERQYVAASVLWFTWILMKKRKQMRERYVEKISSYISRVNELTNSLSLEFDSFVGHNNVVLHIPSAGYPIELRRAVSSAVLAVHENQTALRVSFLRNYMTEVIYVLPVPPDENVVTMLRDLVESCTTSKSIMDRLKFVAVPHMSIFENRSLNLSRTLHCSDCALTTIAKLTRNKRACILPWIIDESDVRLSSMLGIPMVSPSIDLQSKLMSSSTMSEIVEELGLLQPPHARNIRDYHTLCSTLANLIVSHPKICVWLFRLNQGHVEEHTATFVVNHISVPFMPFLRHESERLGTTWDANPTIRKHFLSLLLTELPRIVEITTRLSSFYETWEVFCDHLQKFGCLLQAVPKAKDAGTITVCLFLHGKHSTQSPKWLGTCDKMRLQSFTTNCIYAIPQCLGERQHIVDDVNKLASKLQQEGYFGYLTVDCFCYPRERQEGLHVMIQHVYPYYCEVQQYLDWFKFAIDGSYNGTTDKFDANVAIWLHPQDTESNVVMPRTMLKWNETSGRCALVITEIFHSHFGHYSWTKLKPLMEQCGISYSSVARQGAHLIVQDRPARDTVTLIVIDSVMTETIKKARAYLKKIIRLFTKKSKKKVETNIHRLQDILMELFVRYQNASANPCG